ncbi:MAG: hypothetical protein E7417_06225 [Ruminococcaceae bacterium]|nr:hypothetical protein [Oscillospiraceae bacterium]
MTGTVTRKVDTKDEQQTIDIIPILCWSLSLSQEINNSELHLERRNNDIYSVTAKENYVKLILKRDTG